MKNIFKTAISSIKKINNKSTIHSPTLARTDVFYKNTFYEITKFDFFNFHYQNGIYALNKKKNK